MSTVYTATVHVDNSEPMSEEDAAAAATALKPYRGIPAGTSAGYRQALLTITAATAAEAAVAASTVAEKVLGGAATRIHIASGNDAGDMDLHDIISVADAAAILKVSRQRVHDYIASNRLAAHSVSGRITILRRSEVTQFAHAKMSDREHR